MMETVMMNEIVRELIIEAGGEGLDSEVNTMWGMCRGNPWKAAFLYRLIGDKLAMNEIRDSLDEIDRSPDPVADYYEPSRNRAQWKSETNYRGRKR